MKNIALVIGGFSGEHDISVASGHNVFSCLDKSKYNVYPIIIDPGAWYYVDTEEFPTKTKDFVKTVSVDKNDFSITLEGKHITFDLAFIIVHGNPGENGKLQGYFDIVGVPYTSCGFYSMALTFNKSYCNNYIRNFNVVNVAQSEVFHRDQAIDAQALVDRMGLPLFVKPTAGGSSVATTKVKTIEQLEPAIREALTEDETALVEQFISGREFDCGVLQTKDRRYLFPLTELIPTNGHEFFDYEAKYNDCAQEITPADTTPELAERIQQISSKLYDILDCKGVVRFDYIYDTERDKVFFLEVNTIAGQSVKSIIPTQARAVGISPSQLYDMIIETFI